MTKTSLLCCTRDGSEGDQISIYEIPISKLLNYGDVIILSLSLSPSFSLFLSLSLAALVYFLFVQLALRRLWCWFVINVIIFKFSSAWFTKTPQRKTAPIHTSTQTDLYPS